MPSQDVGKLGVLLLNLGTPDATDFWSMRRYLKEFLSDPRVIETPRWVWWPILNLVILSVRPKRSGALYDKIWDRQADDSPLRVITAAQTQKLRDRLSARDDDNIVVEFAMRYGNPSVQSGLDALQDKGCHKILLLPLYPQYSSATTATVNDKAFEVMGQMRWQPAARTCPPYYNSPMYIESLAANLQQQVSQLDFEPEKLVTSYHGMPQAYVDRGDPYYDQCLETSRLLTEALGWSQDRVIVSFQSRFGPAEWLKPYTDEVLGSLAKEGVRNIAVAAPAFSVDCLETLEELAMGGREQFLDAGGANFAYLSCLNDTDQGMDVIEHLVRQELSGWL